MSITPDAKSNLIESLGSKNQKTKYAKIISILGAVGLISLKLILIAPLSQSCTSALGRQ